MSTTTQTTDQERRLATLLAGDDVARLAVVPIGPASVGAIVAEIFDADGESLHVERIDQHGRWSDAGPWLEVTAEARRAQACDGELVDAIDETQADVATPGGGW